MPRLELPPNILNDLTRHLGETTPARIENRAALTSRGFLPRRFQWDPHACIAGRNTAYLIQAVATAEIPTWVTEPMKRLTGKFRRSKLVVLVRRNAETPTWKIASALVDECVRLGAGLAVEIFEGCCLVFPPSFNPPKRTASRMEAGHIPSWVLRRLTESHGFSPYLTRCLIRLAQKYGQITSRSAPSYDQESDVLIDFARQLRRADPRILVPLDLLSTLATWEHRQQQGSSRDHFFHTFNNLFLGFLILGHLFGARDPLQPPDRYIHDPNANIRVRPWEAIWALTCLFHDPGYIAEKIWFTISFAFSIPNQLPSDQTLPDQIKDQLNNAWDGEHKQTAEEITDLFQRLKRERDWVPPRFDRAQVDVFRKALREVYFDGKNIGHSLLSGIHLINCCITEKTPQRQEYDKEVALTACEVAALSMMFHDQHCRSVMREFEVQPLSFDQLPYAMVLMFVDALQDDRRDINQNRFPKKGILVGLDVYQEGDQMVVKATVSLPELPLKWWPGKIEEYEDVLSWINANSRTRFVIDYKSGAWPSRLQNGARRRRRTR